MKKIIYTVSLTAFLILTSCKGGKHAPQSTDSSQTTSGYSGSTNSQKNGTSNSGPTYSSDIKPIFEKNCIPCHDKGSAIGNWLDYKSTYAKRALIKNRVFEKKDMPLGKPLSDKERSLIAKWIDSGALEANEEVAENNPSPVPSSPTPSNEGSNNNPIPNAEQPATVITPQTPSATDPAESPSSPNLNNIDPEKITYVDNIKPLFEKYCIACHNENSGPVMPNWMQYDIAVLKKDTLLDRVVIKKNMPVEGMPAPSAEEREMLNLWIQKGMKYEIK